MFYIVDFDINLNKIKKTFGLNYDVSVNLFTNRDMNNDSNYFCIIPYFKYDDEFAMSYVDNDMKSSQSLFKACESPNDQDSFKIDRFLQITSEENEIYKLKLNILLIKDEFKTNNRKISLDCTLQRFQKTVNVSEVITEMFSPTYEFNAKNNFELTVNQTGFYYLDCKNLFSHVYIVYPNRMSKLIEQNEVYRKYAENITASFKDPRSILLLNDSYLSECKTNEQNSNEMINLLIIGIDSMSHYNFKRVFPLTYEYLLKKSIIYNNFNSVGHNTYPNVFAFLSGLFSWEDSYSEEFNMTSETDYVVNLDSQFHDHLPLIWKEYEKLGYVTMYQEDDPKIGIFHYYRKGFRYFPTTMYGRGYWLKYYEKRSGPDKCHYKQPTYQTWLNRIDEFVTQMNSNKVNRATPYFSFNFFTEYTHDNLAVPPRFDLKLKEMLENFNEKGYLNNTMLILMTDHGSKLTHYAYATEMGKMERFRPLFTLKFPNKFKDSIYLKNALNNRNKLASYYDAYQTLRHFLHLNKYGMDQSESCRKKFSHNSLKERILRGMSLFNQIPTNRTCTNAIIPFNFCSCFIEKSLSEKEFAKKTGLTFETISLKVTEYVNQLTESNRHKCVAFKLNRTASFKQMLVNNLEVFKVAVVLEPGEAWFEAKIRINDDESIQIDGHPLRVSPYGNQSICIKDSLLVNYCFCVSN